MQTRTIRTTRTSHPGRLPGTGGSTERAAVSGHRPNSYHIPPADRIRTNTRTSFLPIKTMENANSYHSYDSYESSGSAARGGWVWGKAALNGHRPNSYHIPPTGKTRTNTRTSFLPIETMKNANSYHSYDSYESSGSAARGWFQSGSACVCRVKSQFNE
jgi:hypothetical protein